MSEESKTAESDYVIMADTAPTPGRSKTAALGLDDPTLSQEEKDHRLAVAMQQEENAAAYADHKKKHEDAVHAQQNRTARSGTFTKLANIRSKDQGMLQVPAAYTSDHAYHKDSGAPPPSMAPPPLNASAQEIADYQMAANLQKMEQVDAGTIRTMEKIVQEEVQDDESQARRTERSNYHINQKGFMKH